MKVDAEKLNQIANERATRLSKDTGREVYSGIDLNGSQATISFHVSIQEGGCYTLSAIYEWHIESGWRCTHDWND